MKHASEPGWHSRGYLPHFDDGIATQFVTYHLADSLPSHLLREWGFELAHLPDIEATIERRRRIEQFLDRGHGSCWLRRCDIGSMVEESLLFFDGVRYRIHAWVVMPNHVHALFTPLGSRPIKKIVGNWKSFTSKEAAKRLRKRGTFWQADYFDRYIRTQSHFHDEIEYIELNPVKAGLCATPEEWPFSSARFRNPVPCLPDLR